MPAMPVDLLVAAGRLRTVLLSGFAAGVCVFFAPLVVLAIGLLAAYLGYVAGDSSTPALGPGRPLDADDFRAVFAPAVNAPWLVLAAGVCGTALAAFRRRMAQRADPASLAAGIRPFFPEFLVSYALLTIFLLALALGGGGWPQIQRLASAAPVVLIFLLCATWLGHAVWQYCFRNVMELLASAPERDAAAALRAQRPPLRRLPHAR